MGKNLSIDETCLSRGEVYTFLTNKEGHGGLGTMVAVIHGTKAETVIAVLEMICSLKRKVESKYYIRVLSRTQNAYQLAIELTSIYNTAAMLSFELKAKNRTGI